MPPDAPFLDLPKTYVFTFLLPNNSVQLDLRQPIEDMGREMARLVLSLAATRDVGPRQMILGPELALRASTIGAG